ncbi:MAG: DUF2304 domain-containing protein [Candidatus Rokuibacteriota bacterium]
MTDLVQIVAVAVSSLLLLVVIDLVRRHQLTEEYSFIWIVCAGALLVLSVWREILHTIARWLDVRYPPAVLLLVLILFVFVASLYFSVVISRQRAQIERLVEELAILAAEQRELNRARDGDGRTPPA